MRTIVLLSFLLALTFAVLAVSGIALFVAPSGRIANATAWMLAGLARREWEALHVGFALLFALAAICHIALHGRTFLTYLRTRRLAAHMPPREAMVAFAAVLFLAVAAVASWPPMTQIDALHSYLKREAWAAERLPAEASGDPDGAALFAGQCGRCHEPDAAARRLPGDDEAARAFLATHGPGDAASDAAIIRYLRTLQPTAR